jgi:hypothetical protein
LKILPVPVLLELLKAAHTAYKADCKTTPQGWIGQWRESKILSCIKNLEDNQLNPNTALLNLFAQYTPQSNSRLHTYLADVFWKVFQLDKQPMVSLVPSAYVAVYNRTDALFKMAEKTNPEFKAENDKEKLISAKEYMLKQAIAQFKQHVKLTPDVNVVTLAMSKRL